MFMHTVGDVKEAARRVWPTAESFDVQIVHRTDTTPKMYQLTAHDSRNAIVGCMSAATLNELHALLAIAQETTSAKRPFKGLGHRLDSAKSKE